MLADLSVTGYIASNIVKDSTKSAQPMYFLSPRNGVVLRHLLGPNMEGLVEDAALFEPAVNETFRFSETKTNRFIYRDNEQTR